MDLHALMQNVKKIRLLNNLTMKYMADVINCDQGAYSRWESGESEPKISQFAKIADLFEMTLDEIVDFNPESKGKSKKVSYDEMINERNHKIKLMEQKERYLTNETQMLREITETNKKYLSLLEEKVKRKESGEDIRS